MERQNQIEPTYLRYVYDGLQKGSLSGDNAASLPHGFTGVFQDKFCADVSVKERQYQLELFTCFALLNINLIKTVDDFVG